MTMRTIITTDDLLRASARKAPEAIALWREGIALSYAELDARVDRAAGWLRRNLPLRGARVAIWLDKRVDTVVAIFAAMRAGHVAVPLNPALRAAQVRACLADCGAAALFSDGARLSAWASTPAMSTNHSPGVLVDVDAPDCCTRAPNPDNPSTPLLQAGFAERDGEELAILFYTSGSSGAAKGVMVTHANLLAGADAVNRYLDHTADDRLLAALPLSFDAGFSQLTSAFAVGAAVVLLDHLFPADVLSALERDRVTGITGVPPLYLQLAAALPRHSGLRDAARITATATALGGSSLRYFANTGGHLPQPTWLALRQHWPQAEPIAMYGLTEAFRASRLPAEDFARKPDSIGLPIPGGTRLHVMRADGSPCAAGEPGQLVQQGPLVTRGYWNDPARSLERFRPGPDGEPAVWSGDTVWRDDEGYLYFVGRDDEQIKTSGYRVSPSEVEAVAAAAGWPECVAMGVPDATLGHAIVLVVAGSAAAVPDAHAMATDRDSAHEGLLPALRAALPAWMVPRRIEVWDGSLPRNANGKFDRVLIRQRTLQRAAHPQPDPEGDGDD